MPTLLAACQSGDTDGKPNSVFAGDVFGDGQTAPPRRTRDAGYATGGIERASGRPLTQNFGPDAGSSVAPGLRTSDETGSYTVNFQNVDVKEVVRAVLNDALNVSYTISGDLAGPVTVSSAQPVSRNSLLSTLEATLAPFGYALRENGAGYLVAPSGVGSGTVDAGRSITPGYGVSVVPLRFVSASEMLELLSGFVADADGLRIAKSGNAIVARGSSPQRAEVVQAILSFDADFMQDQRVSIFRLVEARPDDVVPELERIFNASGDNTLIQFRPVSRLRGVMAISKNPALIRRAEGWVRRLDQQDADTGQNVVVYKARYRKAAELAKVMNNLFSGGSDAGAASEPPPSAPALEEEGEEGAVARTARGGRDPNEADIRVASAFNGPPAAANAADDGGEAGGGAPPGTVDLTTVYGSERQPIRISADPANNSVVIYGDTERANKILATLRKLDATPLQVAINVTIAEVRLTNELKYGVQYFITSKHLGLGNDNGSVGLIDQASSILKSQIPGLNFVLGSNANPDVIISALDVIGDVEVLSSPSLVVLENQTATLQVGDEVPITTRQSQSIEDDLAPVVNQVEFKNTGIILNVTPRIGQNDAVTMQIEQEISNVASGQNTLTPTITKRRIQSQISVDDGQTVLLGGLISAATDDTKSGVPGAHRLPVIGGLFGKTSKAQNRSELIVLIRPVVIRDAQDASDVAASLRNSMYVIGSRQPPLK